MTDHIPAGKLDQAREWAEWIIQADSQIEVDPDLRGAADVLLALPDEWIDADRVRAIIQPHLEREVTTPSLWRLVKDLEALLPTPTPRTLADLHEDDREHCRGMQASVRGFTTWHILGEDPRHPGSWIVMTPSGRIDSAAPEDIEPLPDEPGLVWPASVPVTEDTPEPAPAQPEDVKPGPQPGEAWLIEYEGKRYQAVYWHSPIYAHWTFLYDWERGPSTVESTEATPVSRLVPERGDVS